MSSSQFTTLFVAAVLLSAALRLWLTLRHRRHVAAHRAAVPAAFADKISLAEHQKAADYTAAKSRLGLLELAVDTAFLLALTVGGVLAWIDGGLTAWLGIGHWQGLALFGAVSLLSSVIGLPFALLFVLRLGMLPMLGVCALLGMAWTLLI